jgi:hypothetical protein
MPLVLGAVVLFVTIGVASRELSWRQTILAAAVAVALAVTQFTFPRFL